MMQRRPIKAILLDRDGTINIERADYVRTPDDLLLLPGAELALQRIGALGLPVAVITNQAGIGRRLITQVAVDAIHAKLDGMAQQEGLRISGYYVCPHHPDDHCACRKPQPGLILQAAAALAVQPEECVVVGDSITDLLAARAAGSRGILVRTGRQGERLESLLEEHGLDAAHTHILPDLLAAADWIATEMESGSPEAAETANWATTMR